MAVARPAPVPAKTVAKAPVRTPAQIQAETNARIAAQLEAQRRAQADLKARAQAQILARQQPAAKPVTGPGASTPVTAKPQPVQQPMQPIGGYNKMLTAPPIEQTPPATPGVIGQPASAVQPPSQTPGPTPGPTPVGQSQTPPMPTVQPMPQPPMQPISAPPLTQPMNSDRWWMNPVQMRSWNQFQATPEYQSYMQNPTVGQKYLPAGFNQSMIEQYNQHNQNLRDYFNQQPNVDQNLPVAIPFAPGPVAGPVAPQQISLQATPDMIQVPMEVRARPWISTI